MQNREKILFCHHGSICEPGMIRALKSLGYELTFPSQETENPEEDVAYMKMLSEKLQQESIDIVFSVNFVPIISEVCQRYQIPYFCWIVDSPVIQLYSDRVSNSCNYIFIFDYALYMEFCDKNRGHIFYQPLGCDIELFDDIKVSREEQKLYQNDVSFVGSLYTEKCLYNSIETKLPDYLRGFFEGILNAQCKIYGYNFLYESLTDDMLELLRKCIVINQCKGYAIDERVMFGNLLLNAKCTEMERINLLNCLAEHFSVDLYTQSDTSKLKGVKCHGMVSSLDGMPKVFKCSKINLNFTTKGIQTGASLRIFDVLGCGGFLISNYQSELAELFEPGKEIILFESEQDLVEKVAYYLSHEQERKEIAQNGYEKVKQNYSYQKQLEKILSHYDRRTKI